MSKEAVYEQRITIPDECQVSLEGKKVTVSGEKGTLERTFPEPQTEIRIEGNELIAGTHISRKRSRALVGTVIAHVRNMIVGVQHGYEYEMKIVYSHFPITAEVKDNTVVIKNFIGERGVRTARLIGDVNVRTTEDEIFISGIDIEHVSQSAANIQQACKIRDKDRRVFLDGIYVIRKRKGETVKSIV
ncbi:MAG: 50S ribosomal protein L6 [Candidatus Thorarchaeota archaeon]|nr:MAG: 50S ribosomal protein L6 [Candidatus Thorarchaeota archaeon]RLI58628.1 MAG: 50S ribosomal protein L6 [Candidatus Thorarchaeota archaeon]